MHMLTQDMREKLLFCNVQHAIMAVLKACSFKLQEFNFVANYNSDACKAFLNNDLPFLSKYIGCRSSLWIEWTLTSTALSVGLTD